MKISDIVAHIKAECPLFATVDHALTAPGDYGYPAAFVSPLKLVAAQPRMNQMKAQMVQHVVGVYVVMKKRTDAVGPSAADEFDDILASLRAAMLGWAPPDNFVGASFDCAGGELTERDGIVAWREDFTIEDDLRAP